MKQYIILFSLLLSISISGCLAEMEEFEAYMSPESSNISTDQSGHCQEGEQKCSDDRKHVMVCFNNQFEVYKSCRYLCSQSACNTIPDDPNPKPDDPNPKPDDPNPKPDDPNPKPDDPNPNVPTPNCSDNESRCVGNYTYLCQDDKWIFQKLCENGCKNGSCINIDPCANKTCPDNFRCDTKNNGDCIEIDPCEGISCLTSQTCIKARCIDNACIQNGSEKNCGAGKTCVNGDCIDDGCKNKTCNPGWKCIKGICEETACIDYFCEEGRTCKGGKCVDNECLDMACGNNMSCSKGNCIYKACLDRAPCPSGKTCNIKGDCEFITAPAITLDIPTDRKTDENGKAISLALHLNNAPTKEVRISCEVITNSANQEVNVDCNGIVFNPINWQSEQTILVYGVADFVKDGDQQYKIKVTTASMDADFNRLTTSSVELTNIDMTKPGFVISDTFLTTYEDQSQPPATLTIQLSSIPASDVSLTLATSNPSEGFASPTSLTFTKYNWNKPQTITVKGKDDTVNDGNVNYTLFFSSAESYDKDYNGIQPIPIKLTNIDNDTAGLTISLPDDFEVSEGEQLSVLVKLNTAPKYNVKVAMTINDATEAAFNVPSIILTQENWNTGVKVSLMGLHDDINDGDQPIKFFFSAASDDDEYNHLAPITIYGVVKDKVNAGFQINSQSVFLPEDSAATPSITVALTAQPKADVTVKVTSSDASELKILGQPTLFFTPSTWNKPQTITLLVQDDNFADGTQTAFVTFSATSTDPNFNGIIGQSATYAITDNESPSVALLIKNTTLTNTSQSTTAAVTLGAPPTSNVTVTLSSNHNAISFSPTELTFTPENWSDSQAIIVNANFNALTTTSTIATIKAKATATGQYNVYNGVISNAVSVNLVKNY